MNQNFQASLTQILKWECVFRDGKVVAEHDPKDPGGTTKYGIDQRSHPDVDIENLTYAQAAKIYRKSYWDKVKGDSLPKGFDVVCFDIAVNNGVGKAGDLLQKALGKLYTGIVDGDIGPLTLEAVSKAGSVELRKLLSLRADYYRSLKQFRVYGKGWLNRNNDLKEYVGF